MTLREEISKIIEENCPVKLERGLKMHAAPHDANIAAMEVLKHLDNKLDLDGNGWFDDDDEMIEFLGY